MGRWSRLDNPSEKKHDFSQAPGPGPGPGPRACEEESKILKSGLKKTLKMRVLAPLGLVTLVLSPIAMLAGQSQLSCLQSRRLQQLRLEIICTTSIRAHRSSQQHQLRQSPRIHWYCKYLNKRGGCNKRSLGSSGAQDLASPDGPVSLDCTPDFFYKGITVCQGS